MYSSRCFEVRVWSAPWDDWDGCKALYSHTGTIGIYSYRSEYSWIWSLWQHHCMLSCVATDSKLEFGALQNRRHAGITTNNQASISYVLKYSSCTSMIHSYGYRKLVFRSNNCYDFVIKQHRVTFRITTKIAVGSQQLGQLLNLLPDWECYERLVLSPKQ